MMKIALIALMVAAVAAQDQQPKMLVQQKRNADLLMASPLNPFARQSSGAGLHVGLDGLNVGMGSVGYVSFNFLICYSILI